MNRLAVLMTAVLGASLSAADCQAQFGPSGSAAPPSPYGAAAQGPQLVVRNAADALGMIRGVGPGESLDSVNRLQFSATGTINSPKGEMTIKETVGISLHQWAARVDRESVAAGKNVRTIEVVADSLAWNEVTPGGDATPSPKDADDRRMTIMMLPQGFLRAVLQADPQAVKVTQEASGATVAMVKGPLTLRATLDANNRPTKVEALQNNRVSREMNYSSYKDFDEYEVFFPTQIVEKRNGRVLATLTVVDFHTAPYVVFPVPPTLRATAKK